MGIVFLLLLLAQFEPEPRFGVSILQEQQLARKTHKKNSKAASIYCKLLLLNKLSLIKRTPLR
jgi:hypothetical protein